MRLARVAGSLWCTAKDRGLSDRKLLLVAPCDPGGRPSGPVRVAADSVGAGAGELVFYVEGREASLPFLPAEVPVDATVVAIVDAATCETL